MSITDSVKWLNIQPEDDQTCGSVAPNWSEKFNIQTSITNQIELLNVFDKADLTTFSEDL